MKEKEAAEAQQNKAAPGSVKRGQADVTVGTWESYLGRVKSDVR